MFKFEITDVYSGVSKKHNKPYQLITFKLNNGKIAREWYFGEKKYQKGEFLKFDIDVDFNFFPKLIIID